MAGVNSAAIVGNLGSDPEIVTLENGSMVAKFSLATSEKWKNKAGETVEETEWHRCEAWGKLAEIIQQWVKKGSQVYVSGKLKTDKWEKDGHKFQSTKIVVRDLTMLGGGQQSQGQPQNTSMNQMPQSSNSAGHEESDDDLPF